MQIRSYQNSDESAVVALWQACGLTRPWNDPHKDIARKLQVQPELFLVGELDGQLIATAMAGYDGHRGWVNYLAVAPEQQRRGYAAQLMQHIEQQLLAMGCPKLNMQVRTSNSAVLAVYRRLGYAQDEAVSLGKRLIPDGPRA
ncbi:MAG: GNAT family acetyltransferase [Burkholderiales bacterium]|nr:GNAT family acetyltransferase [Burkholderiales bacterium]